MNHVVSNTIPSYFLRHLNPNTRDVFRIAHDKNKEIHYRGTAGCEGWHGLFLRQQQQERGGWLTGVASRRGGGGGSWAEGGEG